MYLRVFLVTEPRPLSVLSQAIFTRTSPTLFLDICCISQDDPIKKARGIESLGALLDRSERMLVLLDENYFKRLWCVL